MSEEILSARQRELVRASAAAARAHAAAAVPAAGAVPEVGDVFVLPATADFPVEWALLDRRGAVGPFLAVPGDSHPFLGSRDAEVETSTGFLNLRCQAAVWLEPAACQPDRRVGALAPEDVERALRKLQEVAHPGFTPDPFLEEVDRSPEYQEWLREVVQPARAAASGAAGGVVRPFQAPAAVSSTASPAAGAVPPRARSFPAWAGWAAAAVLLFFMSSGLSIWALRQHHEMQGLAARSAAAEKALEAERARREGGERRSAVEGRREAQEREQEAAALRGRINSLEERLAAASAAQSVGPQVGEPILNAPVAILQPAEVLRGSEPRAYRLPEGAPSLTVVLKFRESEAYPAYRLVLTREGAAAPVWRSDRLERSTEGVQVALPRRLLPPGKYRLSLSGLGSGAAQPVADYELAVAR